MDAAFNNYGIAIVLLSVIVRIVFWPVTHKGIVSRKKIQAIVGKRR
jgi:membrane protein insertase Oxa1/YidC/SpoIIIJ